MQFIKSKKMAGRKIAPDSSLAFIFLPYIFLLFGPAFRVLTNVL